MHKILPPPPEVLVGKSAFLIKGFTLVELVIVIVIVGILSIIAVPIYKGYVDKARITEAKTSLNAIRQAEMIYYAEHGAAYSTKNIVQYDDVLDIDLRSNKWFTSFHALFSTDHMWSRIYDKNGIIITFDYPIGTSTFKPNFYKTDTDGTVTNPI